MAITISIKLKDDFALLKKRGTILHRVIIKMKHLHFFFIYHKRVNFGFVVKVFVSLLT